MSEQPPAGGLPIEINLNIPPELEPGVFANFAGIWTDDDGFVLDFASVVEPPQPGQNDAGVNVMRMRARVVSRVRIPPRQAIELMRTLGGHLDQWERRHGRAQ
jgi:hypothetical protein